jgi:hypothetical protein
MSVYLLKDSTSKQRFAEWIKTMTANYSAAAKLKWADEDALCEHFFSCIRGTLSTAAGDLTVASYKVRGRGRGAAEKRLGADGICIVDIFTPTTRLRGFFLFQAKKATSLSDKLRGASLECSTMLSHTAASYLLTLMPSDAKMSGAMAVHSCAYKDPSLIDVPYVSFARFAAEHLLQGIMLEPFDRLRDFDSEHLSAEIKLVVGILASVDNQRADALRRVEEEIEALGLQVESGG